MKRMVISLGLCFYLLGISFAQSTILIEDFEDGTVLYTTSVSEFSDGGQDYFTRTDGSNTSGDSFSDIQGSFWFGAQDIDGEGATLPVTLNIDDIDISGYTDLILRVYLAEDATGASEHWDAADYVHITGTIDDGTPQNLIWIENLGDTTNGPPGLDLDFDGSGDGTEITDAFVQFSVNITGTGSLLDIEIEFDLDSGDEDIAIDNIEILGTASAADPEPSNHVTGFTATANGSDEINLSWTDAATGSQAPDGYIIYANTNSGSLPTPIDATDPSTDSDLSDGSAIVKVSHGGGAATSFTGLLSETQYFFQIWSYTNSGSDIDFKTSPAGPASDATTAEEEFDVDFEDDDFGDWIAYSVSSNLDWSVNTSDGANATSSSARINNFGGDESADDWLISPEVDLTEYVNPALDFYILYDFLDEDRFGLEVFVSTDYSGSGDPSVATWDSLDLTALGYPSAEEVWENRSLSLADYEDESSVYIAFRYQSSGTGSGSTIQWNVDEVSIQTSVTISGNDGWRLLSFPVTGGVVTDISDDTPVQGIENGDDEESDANFLYYNIASGWQPPADVSSPFGDGYGFALYFFDNFINGSSELPVVLDAEGDEPASDVTVTLNNSVSPGSVGSGGTGETNSYYTLVGNPFTSSFDLNSMTTDGANPIQEEVQFWNDAGNTYVQGNIATEYIIAPWQGFWVEVANGNDAGDLTFPASGKTTSAPDGVFLSKETKENRADITFQLQSENTLDKAIKLAFRDYATFEFDRADASKLVPLSTTYATMAFKSSDRLKSVESLPWDLTEEITLNLEHQLVGVSGDFTFSWTGIETISYDWELILHDNETGQSINMRDTGEYTFHGKSASNEKVNPLSILKGPAAVTQVSKAKDGTRFGITIRPTSTVSTEPGDAPARFALHQNYPNPFNPSTVISYQVPENGLVTLEVYDLMGRKVAELVNGVKAGGEHNVTWNAAGMSSGMYYYRLTAAGQTMTRKMTLIK